MSPIGRRRRPAENKERLAGLLVFMMQMAADVQQQYDESGRAEHLQFAIDTWGKLRDLVQREPRTAAAVLGQGMISHSLNELGLDLLADGEDNPGTERFHEAAEVLRNAADWAAPGSIRQTDALVNASYVLMACWERSASPADLDGAVAAGEAAIAANPSIRSGSPDRHEPEPGRGQTARHRRAWPGPGSGGGLLHAGGQSP